MNIDEMIAVLKAYQDGAEIEFKAYYTNWTIDKDPDWNFAKWKYRVKPQLKKPDPLQKMTIE